VLTPGVGADFLFIPGVQLVGGVDGRLVFHVLEVMHEVDRLVVLARPHHLHGNIACFA
jgi:hypothetical protein